MQRKAYHLKAGSLSKMNAIVERLPSPDPGEVTVAVRAIGLNFADIFAIWGLYGATPEGDFVPGLEYSGTIAAVGEGVEGLREGDHIMGVTRFGAYATHLNIDARYVIPLPAGWSFAEGSAYLVQVLTAYYGLKLLYYYLTRPKIDPQKMPEQNKSVMGFNLIWLYHRAGLMHQLLGELSELDLGKPHVGHRYAFGALKDAILEFQSGKTMGKVVVEVEEE